MGPSVKLLGMGVALTVIPLIVLGGSVWSAGRQAEASAEDGARVLARADLDHVVQLADLAAQACDADLRRQLIFVIASARHAVQRHGSISLRRTRTVTWTTRNQFTSEAGRLTLPAVQLGHRFIPPNPDPKTRTELVDDVRPPGGTATIFQRMNEAGDMLRIATSVLTSDGRRAIGTYIPANQGGQPNQVIAAVLRGDTFIGRAFVVNAWSLTAYEPIRDHGQTIGMLYVGLAEKDTTEELLTRLQGITIGRTGYVYILQGTGADRGRYVLSADRRRDGENLWDAKDSDGRPFIQQIVNEAVTSPPGHTGEIQYPWKNARDAAPVMKLARFKYFAPWDWVIAASIPEDELWATPRAVARLNRRSNTIAIVATLLSFSLSAVVWSRVSRRLHRQTVDLAVSHQTLAKEMTARLHMEVEMRQAHKLEAVGRLASGVAHEINTPVQFVSHSICFVRDGVNDLLTLVQKLGAVQRAVLQGAPAHDAAVEAIEAQEAADVPYLVEHLPQAVTRALDGLERVATIVRSMKAFAHPDQTEMMSIDLNEAIQNTVIVAGHEFKYVADLETNLGPIPPVVCHAGEMNQAVLNIIVNAAHAVGDVVKGTATKGRIVVRTYRDGADVVIAISDTGGGIPADIRGRIFDPFFTTKEVGRGTGQGLFIAHSVVVEKHRGQLTFDTEMGVGTTFFVRLPLAADRSSAGASA